MKLSSSSRRHIEVGSIINNINIDMMSINVFISNGNFLLSAPFMILGGIAMLIVEVGWIGLVAPLMFGIGMIIQQFFMTKGFKFRN